MDVIASKSHQKALENQATLKLVRGKFRKIAKKSNKSPKFKYMPTIKQTEKGLAVKTLKQEIKTRFNSTHTCFKSFLNDPNNNKDEPMDEEKVMENIEAINETMKAVKLKKDEWTWWEESFWCSLAPTLPQGWYAGPDTR